MSLDSIELAENLLLSLTIPAQHQSGRVTRSIQDFSVGHNI